jgi:hypothetical protein
MKVFLAIILYFTVIFSFLQNWLLLLFVSLVVFSIRFGAVALIPAAILIDGYFGNYYEYPYLSFVTILWFVLIEYLRPKIIDVESRNT